MDFIIRAVILLIAAAVVGILYEACGEAIDEFFERNVFENKDKLTAILLYPFGLCWECLKYTSLLMAVIIPLIIIWEILKFILSFPGGLVEGQIWFDR